VCLGADVSVRNMLKMPTLNAEISNVRTAQDCMNAAQNAELVASLDHTITKWCSEIEKVQRWSFSKLFNHSSR